MSKSKQARLACENSQFLHRLSMERCRSYVTHMRAILHMCEDSGEDITDALHQMIHVLDLELTHSLKKIG